jgi:hypothetical protein
MSTGVALSAYVAGFGAAMIPVTVSGQPHVEAIKPEAMGKSPGKRRRDGIWYPLGVPGWQGCDEGLAREIDGWAGNIGLCCGGEAGLVAIDNDADDPEAARIINDTVRAMLGDVPCRGVDAPGHTRLLFPVRLSDTLPNGTKMTFIKDNKTASIDLLSSGKQFVAWGIHSRTGKPYAWSQDLTSWEDGTFQFPEITFQRLGEIIGAIEHAMAEASWVKSSGAVSTLTHHAVDPTARRVATESELSRWLALLPNRDEDTQFDDRHVWVGMAHAIYGASDGADWGRELWLRWNAQRTQTPNAAEHVWDTLGGEGRVGLDFVREKARERSPTQAAQLDFELAPVPDTDALAVSATTGAIWPAVLLRYVFITAQDRFYDMHTGMTLSHRAFDTVLGAMAGKLRNELTPNDKRHLTPSQLFAMHPQAVKSDNFIYWPGQPRLTKDGDGRMFVNLWRASTFAHKPNVKEVDIQPWLDLVEFVCGSKAIADKFIKWLAFTVKMPGDKANWHPLFLTKPGIGKDTMLLPVIRGVGRSNAREVTADDLSNQWTDFLEARLVFVSETRQHSRGSKSSHDVMNDLKAFLADKPEMVGVHRKGRDKYNIPNLTQWVFFSNETQPVYLAEGDRRIWVIENFKAVRQPPAYYEAFYHWYDRHPDLVANYLMDFPLTAQDVKELKSVAPDTEAKKNMISSSRRPVAAALEELIEDAVNGQTFPTLVVTLKDVMAELKQVTTDIPSAMVLATHLKQLGARPVVVNSRGSAGPVRLPGTKDDFRRLWLLAERDAKGRDYSGLDPKDYATLYVDHRFPATGTRTTSTGETLTTVPAAASEI